jgi:hypothetical protein
MEERVLFDNGRQRVTPARVTLDGGATYYSTANIASVRTEIIPPPPVRTGCQTTLIVIGVFGCLIGFGVMTSSASSGLLTLLFAGGLPLALGILWLKSVRRPLTTYRVLIASAAGEQEALRSENQAFIADVASAISSAIAMRG